MRSLNAAVTGADLRSGNTAGVVRARLRSALFKLGLLTATGSRPLAHYTVAETCEFIAALNP